MKSLDERTVFSAAGALEWVAAMEDAMRASVMGGFVMPQRMHLERGDDTFLVMPCIAEDYWITKLVSFCPGNKRTGLPPIYGTVVLGRTSTGEPLAVLHGGTLTALRTAAVSALGIRCLAPQGVTNLGIIGTGTQGLQQARFACVVRDIRQVAVYDKSPEAVVRFLETFKREHPRLDVRAARDGAEVCASSEVVITATDAKEPVVPSAPELLEGRTFIGIGSYRPDCREYPDALFRLIDQVFVDAVHGRSESGDLIAPVREGLINESQLHSLGSLILGHLTLSARPTRFYKTVGSALFDLYAAKLVHERTSGLV